jgi:hypothetical protein
MKETTSVVAASEGTDDEGYAAGWRANVRADGSVIDAALPADTYDARGHDGQRIVVVPSAKLVVVRLGFSPDAEDLDLVKTLAAIPARADPVRRSSRGPSWRRRPRDREADDLDGC